ncbi:hypothetical protein N0V90_010068 [Kalmusia sp. IMI 367209]|nr:hypothetical protein N0V90_010068 [Kalmusia sp. IMI 367209]
MANFQDFHSMDSLRTAEQIQLLDLVDSLRAEGLSEFTALPQLIVCGDQSAGKSSLLEAISGVPFPRKDNLCTRFATEVILRRASGSEIKVSLVPGKGRSSAEQGRLWQFRHEISSLEDFNTLFEQAKDAMGLLSVGANAFTEDILRVEIFGPKQPQLTIVDLPGLIHSHNKHQTENDVELVTNLVAKYMANPRSIILAVVSAKNDFPNQIVLKRAREVDPHGLRTLGVITKPDQLISGSDDEKTFLSLARNEQVEFNLGWHVVRNLDSNDKDEDRDAIETQFLAESNFRSLSATFLGIAHLRQRLSAVLFEQIKAELPLLIEDITIGISSCQHGLEQLGSARVTLDDQRKFLVDLSGNFQSLCEAAAKGDYEHDFFADQSLSARRLSAMIANRGVKFEEEIRTEGARWKIVEGVSRKKNHLTRAEAVEDVRKLLRMSRGRELPGLPNPLLVGEVFREYSQPWEGLARRYIKDVWNITKGFVEQVLLHLTDNIVSDALLRSLLDPIMDDRLTLANAKLDELMAVHKEYPETRNRSFTERYNALQQRQWETKTTRVLEEAFEKNGDMTADDVPHLLELLRQHTEIDADRVAAESTFNAMEAFYKVAIKLFIDNVPNLVVRAIIASRLPAMFCPQSVCAMSPDLVRKIASETEDKTVRRQELSAKLTALEAGHDLCKQYALRVVYLKHDSIASEPPLAPYSPIIYGNNLQSLPSPSRQPKNTLRPYSPARPERRQPKSLANILYNTATRKKYDVPDYCFLIEHPPTGNHYIFDLGMRKDLENLPPTLVKNTLPVFDSYPKSPADILKKHGTPEQQPERAKAVLFSHVHFDHVGDGAKARFTNAELWVGPTCCTYARPGYPDSEGAPVLSENFPTDGSRKIVEAFVSDARLEKDGDGRAGKVAEAQKEGKYEAVELRDPGDEGWIGLGAFERALDVFGDGSAYLVDAPGHSPGHQMLLVRVTSSSGSSDDDSFVLLAGDCYHHPDLLKDPRLTARPPYAKGGMHADPEVAVDTMFRTREFAQKDNVWVMGAHDFSVGEALRKGEKEIEGLISINDWWEKKWKPHI